MSCPHCQSVNPAEAKFCLHCGTRLAQVCTQCQLVLPLEAKFCMACGHALTAESTSETLAEQPVWDEATPIQPRISDAERRQLTVMFCDLVGSTALSHQLDPEDFREVVRTYQQHSVEVIQRFDGHIAQYLGDGLLVYSGYPQAHEDDAQRAICIGLGIVEAITHLNPLLEQQYGVRLAVRVGIHTGPVVVGEVGGGERYEQLALGETPNVAARLEGLAPSNQVVMSAATRQLVGGAFDLEDLGVHTMKGVAEPMQVYGIRGERAVESRFEAAVTTGLTPLVGRDKDIGLVRRRWDQAMSGEGQVVLLCGEPGIGKSRLLQVLMTQVAAEPHIRLRYQCSPYHNNSTFYPIIMQLERAAQMTQDDTSVQRLTKLEDFLTQATDEIADVVPLLAALLAIPTGDRYASLALSPQRQKTKTIEALTAQLMGLAQQQPVLFLFEDAHWSDPTTLETLDYLVQHVANVRVLVVITYRPEFSPLWSGMSHVTTHTLNRLTRRQGATLVAGVTGSKTLPDVVLDQIVAKTDGVPLFIEELTKTVIESGFLLDQGEHYALAGPVPPLAIPTTLQDSLMARLDRLASVKEVAQLGAVIGREFAYDLIAALSPLQNQALDGALAQLVDAGLLFRRGTPPEATYLFKHALVQDAAYASLLRSTRQQLHLRLAMVLDAQFPALVEAEPEVVAHHYTEAGHIAQALPYWQRAGVRAVQRSANVEAINYFTMGLELLATLPDTSERTQQELLLQTALGIPLTATRGWGSPEVGATYSWARELCQQLGDHPQLFSVLFGLWTFYAVRAEHTIVQELVEQLLSLANRQQDPDLLLQAHVAAGIASFSWGAFGAAQEHFKQTLAIYTPSRHHAHVYVYTVEPGVMSLVFLGWTLWCLGYPAQARARIHEAVTLAHELSHPFSSAIALALGTPVAQFCRAVHGTQTQAETAIALCAEQEFAFYLMMGIIERGWALAKQGQAEEGMIQIRQGLVDYQATGAAWGLPYFLSLQAETYGNAGHTAAGLRTLAKALEVVEQTEERFIEAELYRLKGELLLATAPEHATEAETCFVHALDVARQQHGRSWELRTATSLARLWQSQAKFQDAYDLLAPIYGWFTEGFDTADLQEAKYLLDKLSEEVRTPTA